MDKLVVRGTEINIRWNPNRDDYISLTDIAKIKGNDNPRHIVQNWLRNRNIIEFLGVWETLYNDKLDAFFLAFVYLASIAILLIKHNLHVFQTSPKQFPANSIGKTERCLF